MGTYLEKLEALRAEYLEELDVKRQDVAQFEKQAALARVEVRDLEEAIARLSGKTPSSEVVKAEQVGPVTKGEPRLTILPPATARGRRNKTAWLSVIRREFPDREFSTRELAAAGGASMNGTLTALNKLHEGGYLSRRGGSDDPSQHEVRWSLRRFARVPAPQPVPSEFGRGL